MQSQKKLNFQAHHGLFEGVDLQGQVATCQEFEDLLANQVNVTCTVLAFQQQLDSFYTLLSEFEDPNEY